MLACAVLGVCHCGQAQFGEQREGVVSTVALFPADGVISVHEPPIARVTWTNGGAGVATIITGNDSRPSAQFEMTDAAGHVITRTFPDNDTITYAYNDAGWLRRIEA